MRIEKKKNEMKVNNKHGYLAIASFIIFSLLAWMVYSNFSPLIGLEENTANLFQQLFGNPTMTYSDGLFNSLMTFFASYLSAKYLSLLSLVIAVFLFIKRYQGLALWFLGVISTGGVVGILLKKIFTRERPLNHLSWDTGYSFPSGHAIAASLFFAAILLVLIAKIKNKGVRRGLTGLIYFVWLGTLFSRLYFHAHHLGDLIAGVSFGVFWVIVTMFIYQLAFDCLRKKFPRKII